MRKDFESAYKIFLEAWGEESQERMAIEEMSELTKELCKNWRKSKKDTPEQIEHICEEIADVQNMIDQMQLIFGIEKVEKYREEKIIRTQKRLDEEINSNG